LVLVDVSKWPYDKDAIIATVANRCSGHLGCMNCWKWYFVPTGRT